MAKKICTQCGYQGFEQTQTKGSLGMEILLWILGLLTGGILLLAAIPYSLWRICSKSKVCPKCSGTNMIPLDTPVGRDLAAKFTPNKTQTEGEK